MLDSQRDGEYIQWLGHRSDVLELLNQSHIMAFPSFLNFHVCNFPPGREVQLC